MFARNLFGIFTGDLRGVAYGDLLDAPAK